ncbi:hypothetical protein ACIQMR_32510 [Streptomyces sp. NPDC091376]|uniref:hypothetical protein n=1 Tax=Streptomyces sp. NPDC091376 TaxID=3365994 RepID=UPI003823D80A
MKGRCDLCQHVTRSCGRAPWRLTGAGANPGPLRPNSAELSTDNGAFKAARTGTEADFRIVLAAGKGTPSTAVADGSTVSLARTP